MNSIKKLFRHSSVPQVENKTSKSGNNNLKSPDMKKSCLKSSNSGPETVQTKWADLKNIDDDEINDDEEDLSDSKEFALKDKRRASVIISKKVWNNRRNSSQSNTSSVSESSETFSVSENDEKDPNKKLSIREKFENPDTRKSNSRGFNDFCVSKIKESSLGRREIEIATQEMKGFLSVIEMLEESKPIKGALILGCTHITAQTAVLIEGLVSLGAMVRWCACNIYSTQNEVAAALAESGIPIFAWKGQTEDDFWWSIDQCINVKNKNVIDMILDDGGDLTQRILKVNPEALNGCKGIVEESKTGIHRLYHVLKNKTLNCPAINMNESVTKSKFDSYFLCKETIIDALKRSTDTTISGKVVLVCGYGSVGKGCCQALRGMGAHIIVSEIDPICSIQACIEGYRVVLLNEGLSQADIVITCTGTMSLLSASDFEKLKDCCIICNMGHPTSEIDVESLHEKGVVWERIRDDVDYIILPSTKKIILIAQGRVANLNCSTVPSIVMSITSTAQVLALVELYTATEGRYKNEIYVIPKKCDELIAKSHLSIFGAQVNELTEKQAKYLGVNKNGPFKTSYYRY